ncbi:MGMT family protein [Ammonicoccus fulvus]|uniref:MGMT family protein n=1 Tax=Ammonicoccus fulvus TaxID=3138240 RepID=A0ABZ3FNG9_9ACTN
MTPAPSETVERVLLAAELVPLGQVVSYGDLAGLVGTSARRVGTVMSRYGSGVPWWRVTSAAGQLPLDILGRAKEHWADEGIGVTASGRGCRIGCHRADLVALADAYARETAGD